MYVKNKQREKEDTKGGIIIPKDNFKGFVESFKKYFPWKKSKNFYRSFKKKGSVLIKDS